jgi:uncharacterized coiled-coil DUF342 family protein
LEEELRQVERVIETRRLGREEERRLVERAKRLASQLRVAHAVARARAELEEALEAFRQKKAEVDELSRVLKDTAPRLAEARERVAGLRGTLIQLRGERAAVEANMLELARKFADIAGRIGALRARRRELMAHMREEAKEELRSRARAMLEEARAAALAKAQGGGKLTLEELKLIYGEPDEEL